MTDLFDPRRTLPTLSYWQPWASLHVAGLKWHETRHWPTRVRGAVAIHAAKRIDRENAPHDLCVFEWGADWAEDMPTGCVVAVAELVSCLSTDALIGREMPECDALSGNFAPGRFAFRMENVRPLREPIPLIGRQGFFRWLAPEDLEARLLPPVDQAAAAMRWDLAA